MDLKDSSIALTNSFKPLLQRHLLELVWQKYAKTDEKKGDEHKFVARTLTIGVGRSGSGLRIVRAMRHGYETQPDGK